MCSKRYLRLLVLFLLLSAIQPCYCFSEVVLTDQEAQEIMTEIEQAKTDLKTVNDKLSLSEKTCEELQKQQQDVKNTYEEQKKSYEVQLREVIAKNNALTVGIVALSVTILLIIL